ncbi:MAG: creatininase family protein [Clostridia bacterium]|nr:creatininase family protein [Clostridia bacterium]
METRWLYLSGEELEKMREISHDTCVIPMGCIEKHGLHLPLGTDILKGSAVTYRASQIEPVCVFADFTFGNVPSTPPHRPMGTIHLPLEIQIQMLELLCEQIASHGFRKILVVNSHGGNTTWLNVFTSSIIPQKKRSFVFAHTKAPKTAPQLMAEMLIENGSGSIPELTKEDEATLLHLHEMNMKTGHACFFETSYMMGFAPETVHLEKLGKETGKNYHVADYFKENEIFVPDAGWGFNYPNAYAGDDPVECNERIGKASLRIGSEILAKRIKLFKEDENLYTWTMNNQNGIKNDYLK